MLVKGDTACNKSRVHYVYHLLSSSGQFMQGNLQIQDGSIVWRACVMLYYLFWEVGAVVEWTTMDAASAPALDDQDQYKCSIHNALPLKARYDNDIAVILDDHCPNLNIYIYTNLNILLKLSIDIQAYPIETKSLVAGVPKCMMLTSMWHHRMGTFSTSLALWMENLPNTREFLIQQRVSDAGFL